MSTEEKDYGPKVAAALLGVIVAEYVRNGVTRDELVALVGDMYDSVEAHLKPIGQVGVVPAMIEEEITRLRDVMATGPGPDSDRAEYLLEQFGQSIRKIRAEL